MNRELEQEFQNDTEAIMSYLQENNLFDVGHNNDRADRCYSILEKSGNTYKKRAYADILKKQMTPILKRLDACISKIQSTPDEAYNRQNEYQEYYTALKNALAETDTDALVDAWAIVDQKWMSIDTPFQPGHPLEAYDDPYRKAVSIEFDLRIAEPNLFKSHVQDDVRSMFEGFYDEIGRQ